MGVAVLHAVVARQVGHGLGRGDDVVNGQGVFGVGQRYLAVDGGSKLLQLGDGGVDRVTHAVLHAIDKIFFWYAKLDPLQVGNQRFSIVRHRTIHRCGVLCVISGDGVQHQRGVGDVLCHRPDLVEGAAEGDQAESGHEPVCRLEADDAAEAGGLADAAAGVRAQRVERLTSGYGCRRPAAGAARHALQIPRVARGEEGGVLGG